MLVLVLIAVGAVVGLSLGLIVGRGWMRELGLALAGFAVWAVWSVYALVAECPAGRECTPGLGAFYGLFVLAGWLAGAGVVAFVRRGGGGMGARSLAAAGATVLILGSLVFYGVFGWNISRWGCPSQIELERPRSQNEVTEAFADEGLRLERIGWPAELLRARSYEDATVLRHEVPGATLTILVCAAHCEVNRFQLRPGSPRQRFRFGFALGNNIAGWIQGGDRSADAALREPLSRAVDGLDVAVDPDSRCYIN